MKVFIRIKTAIGIQLRLFSSKHLIVLSCSIKKYPFVVVRNRFCVSPLLNLI